MRFQRSLAWAMVVGTAGSTALADPFVQVFQYSAYPPTSGNFITQDVGTTHGDDVIFTLEEDTRYVMVLPLGGTGPYNLDVDIGRIYPQVGSITTPREVMLSVGGKFVTTGENGGTLSDPTEQHWGHYWAGIQEPTNVNGSGQQIVTINLYAAIGNSLTDSISVSKLTRLDMVAELAADVTVEHGINAVTSIVARQMLHKPLVQATAPKVWIKDGNLELFELSGRTYASGVELAAMGEGSILQVDDGDVNVIRTGVAASSTIGTIEGVISVPDGAISTIEVEYGTITDPTNNSAINYRVTAKNGIGSITADAIDCDIITNYNDPTASGLGYLENLRTLSGDFTGVLQTRGVGLPGGSDPYRVQIADDLTGTFTIDESVQSVTGLPAITIGGELAATSRILIGDYLKGDSSNGGIVFASGGLKGQVVVNRNGGSTVSTDYWESTVEVENSTPSLLTTNFYATTSDELGGGAVGVVPFNLHEEDSYSIAGHGTARNLRDQPHRHDARAAHQRHRPHLLRPDQGSCYRGRAPSVLA